MNGKYKIIITTEDGNALETTTEIELKPKNVGVIGHCGSGKTTLVEAMKQGYLTQTECNIEPELDEFDKAGFSLSQEDKDKLISVASRCGVDMAGLISLLIANTKEYKQSKLDFISYSPYVVNKSFNHFVKRLEDDLKNDRVKFNNGDNLIDILEDIKPKQKNNHNWEKKKFWE